MADYTAVVNEMKRAHCAEIKSYVVTNFLCRLVSLLVSPYSLYSKHVPIVSAVCSIAWCILHISIYFFTRNPRRIFRTQRKEAYKYPRIIK
ncbi:hypothetical protein BJV82DRAFT_622409 [Fennellomyces sp. T-0311]|nr:hypothetical protein BJV82DRAFT_622409 [Fennellomyces sp. T-0311]